VSGDNRGLLDNALLLGAKLQAHELCHASSFDVVRVANP